MVVVLTKGRVCRKYVTAGMSHITYLKIGGTITRLTRTMELELLNSPRTTKEARTKPWSDWLRWRS